MRDAYLRLLFSEKPHEVLFSSSDSLPGRLIYSSPFESPEFMLWKTCPSRRSRLAGGRSRHRSEIKQISCLDRKSTSLRRWNWVTLLSDESDPAEFELGASLAKMRLAKSRGGLFVCREDSLFPKFLESPRLIGGWRRGSVDARRWLSTSSA